MHRSVVILAVVSMSVLFGCTPGQDLTISSPNGRLTVSVASSFGQLFYVVMVERDTLVAPSRLGILIAGESADQKLSIQQTSTRSGNETWTPEVGKRALVVDQYNEIRVRVGVGDPITRVQDVLFRAYDEGVAFRYILGPDGEPEQNVTVVQDLSTIHFPDTDAEVWSYLPERRPLGPERISGIGELRRYPVVVRNQNGFWMAVSEADLHDFDNFDLRFPEGESIAHVHIDTSHVATAFSMPWRVIMISEDPKSFVDSDMLVNLSAPAEGDFSWVIPGVSLWDWRAWGHRTEDGFSYGLEIESWKRFIDFAAEHGIPYMLLDANWYGPEHSTLSNPFEGGKAAQVKEALEYGKENGVGLILYLNDRASVNFSIEDIVAAYAEWGAVGIKYGFMEGAGQEKVRKTERIVRACAKHRLMVNFHDGPIPPTGHERTWPNWNTREYVHAQSDALRTHSPGDFVHLAYLNTIAGPIDGNHGMFDHEHAVAERPKMFEELYSTIVAETARTLILYSGLTVLPDSPDSYREHPDLFRFFEAQKQPWKQSATLAGDFGKWITTMRQAQDGTFLVASATDESARSVRISLDFLESGKTYSVTLFEDAEDAHYRTNRSAYTVRTLDVVSEDHIEARLAPGGGHAMLITAK